MATLHHSGFDPSQLLSRSPNAQMVEQRHQQCHNRLARNRPALRSDATAASNGPSPPSSHQSQVEDQYSDKQCRANSERHPLFPQAIRRF